MSDLSPKQKLMIAKQQLDKLSIFICNLADYFKGASPVIDTQLQEIKSLLSGKPNYDVAIELSAEVNAELKKDSKYLRQKNADTLAQIQKTLRQVMESNGINHDLKSEIKQYIASLRSDDSASSKTPINELEKALLIFKKALIHTNSSQMKGEYLQQNSLHEQIIRELKELIQPYYEKNESNTTFRELNQMLQKGLNHNELLECCLTAVRFMVRHILSESAAATELINDIHQSLTKINQGIKTTITNSRSRLNKREAENKRLIEQITTLEASITDEDEISQIKKHASDYLNELQSSLEQNEQEERSEQQRMIALLISMQKRLERLEEKANRYKEELKVQQMASVTDGLTQLPNRLAYEDKVKAIYEYTPENLENTYLAILDIDHFKRINDQYGHSVGDKTLQVIASHTRKYLHEKDFLARWGGEEFVGLIIASTDEEAINKLELVRQRIAKLPFAFKGNKVTITVSIGIAKLGKYANLTEAFNTADQLLYKAKQNGRNQTCY